MEWRSLIGWFTIIILVLALIVAPACGSGNNPPQISGITPSPTGVGPGGSVTISCSANDADGDTLTYQWSASGGAITWSGNVANWIAPAIEGTFTITVNVSDGKGGTDSESCYITVSGAIGTINITSAPVGAQVYLDGKATGKVTPCSIENLTTGGYTVKLTYYHYKDKVGTATVNTGVVTYIDWTMEYAHEKSQTIQPQFTGGDDAYVWQDAPAANYGAEKRLYVGGDVMNRFYRSYLQFSVGIIPATAVITEAKVGVFYEGTSSAVPAVIGVHNVISSWDEANITWAIQPNWTAIPESTISVPAAQTQDFVYWDITNLVQGWVDGAITNRGVLIKDTDENTVKAWKRFYSANEDLETESRPKLVITYFNPAP